MFQDSKTIPVDPSGKVLENVLPEIIRTLLVKFWKMFSLKSLANPHKSINRLYFW